MKGILYLTWRYLAYHRLKSVILVGSITLILASLSSMGLHAVWKAAKLPSINQPGA